MTVLADLSSLARDQRKPVDDVIGLVLATIRQAIRTQPRSLQVEVGPSELGVECARKLAYKLAGAGEVNTRRVPWRPYVGTAVHDKLEQVFVEANAGRSVEWLAELRVCVGELARKGTLVPITGHSDLMALLGGTVIDWKIVGPSSLKKYRSKRHPGEQYRRQAHLYGRGYARRGLPVDDVCVVFLPSNGEFDDAYVWHEPYDEQVALDTLERAQAVQNLVDAVGAAAPGMLPAVDDNCAYCPFFAPGSDDLERGCPGVEPAPEPPKPGKFAGLV